MVPDVRYTDTNGPSLHIKSHMNIIYSAVKNIRNNKGASRRQEQHNEVHKLYALPNIIRAIKSRRTRRKGHLTIVEEVRNIYNTVVRKISLVSSWRRLEDNIKMDHNEVSILIQSVRSI
jgi:uncharacterized protein (UPF0305 family)